MGKKFAVSFTLKSSFHILGSPVYIIAALLQMSAYGGSDAQSIKDGIDSVFKNESPLKVDGFLNKLVGATSDEDSVNFG